MREGRARLLSVAGLIPNMCSKKGSEEGRKHLMILVCNLFSRCLLQ